MTPVGDPVLLLETTVLKLNVVPLSAICALLEVVALMSNRAQPPLAARPGAGLGFAVATVMTKGLPVVPFPVMTGVFQVPAEKLVVMPAWVTPVKPSGKVILMLRTTLLALVSVFSTTKEKV